VDCPFAAPYALLSNRKKATIWAWLVLMVFAITGRSIFDAFGISVNSLRIVGGTVFFSPA
jgi:small neutral amino acid transporter SnatA (MarC family)